MEQPLLSVVFHNLVRYIELDGSSSGTEILPAHCGGYKNKPTAWTRIRVVPWWLWLRT